MITAEEAIVRLNAYGIHADHCSHYMPIIEQLLERLDAATAGTMDNLDLVKLHEAVKMWATELDQMEILGSVLRLIASYPKKIEGARNIPTRFADLPEGSPSILCTANYNNTLFFGTDKGLFMFDPKSETLVPVPCTPLQKTEGEEK